jgi:molybdopterin converting factor small subunit
MTISIDFFGKMRTATQTGSIHMPITAQSRVLDALAYVRENYPDLTLRDDSLVVTVNHKVARLDQPLHPNDSITFVPFIGGG